MPNDITPHESEIRWESTADSLMDALEPHWPKVEAVLQDLQRERRSRIYTIRSKTAVTRIRNGGGHD